jgi:hypothetical protein
MYLEWRAIAKALSGTVVEELFDSDDLLFSDLGEVRSLGEVLPEEAIGIFIRPSLPGAMGMREIDRDPEF